MKNVFLIFEDTKSLPATATLFRNPIAELKAVELKDVESVLLEMNDWSKRGYFVAGAATYEAGWAFLKVTPKDLKKSQGPLLHFYVFKESETIRFEDLSFFHEPHTEPKFIYDISENVTFPDYVKNLVLLKKYFFSGDTYQTNFSLRQRFKTLLSPQALYKSLRAYQKVGHGVFCNFPEGAILSFSPELFLKKEKGEIVTMPMKGTAPRSAKPAVDEANMRFLQTDEKTLAENLMIVDLLRNDLGKIAHPGSVCVENLFQVQSFETLHQMVTTIKAQVKVDIPILDVFKALFPCGSITGAPKQRTMEIIEELETEARGIYTGSLGYITPQNDFYFNVAIRTLVQTAPHSYELGLGGGILIDSNIESEYKECLLKGQFVKKINESFSIFETFLFDGLSCRHLEDHLNRLEKSCRFFGFSFDREEAKSRLRSFLRGAPNKPVKIKLSVGVAGHIQLDVASVGPVREKSPTVSISEFRTNSSDLFLYHKTSHRHLYDNEGRLAVRDGHYETLFFNEKDELTEASRHNVFLNLQNEWFTPPVLCGVLPGIQRSITISEISAKEKILGREDLVSARQIILTNSVRGAVEVKLKGKS